LVLSDSPLRLLTELSPAHKEQWTKQIKTARRKFINSPKYFVEKALQQGVAFDENRVSEYIKDVRALAWQFYLEEELVFHKEMMNFLLEKNEYASTVLASAISEHLDSNKAVIEQSEIAKVVGQTAGFLTPYLYALCLSSTNSRRSRSGKGFERIIDHIIVDRYAYPFKSQASLGSSFYKDNDIGKMVDGIIPSQEAFHQNRSYCVFITMKTSLRERWQQVAEEQKRTNIPTVHLLTLDDEISEANAKRMSHQNINLIVPEIEKLRLTSADNVTSFEKFFNHTIPNYLKFWES
jgi:hypothetical protein